MKHLHTQLCASFSWYDRWHKNPIANRVNWVLFLTFALVYTNGLLAMITAEVTHIAGDQLVPLAHRAIERSPVDLSALEVRLKEVTDRALSRADEHARSAQGKDVQSKEELRKALETRKNTLNELVLTDPSTVRRFVMNEHALFAIPEDLRSYTEKPFTQKGVYRIYLVSEVFGVDEKSHEEYYLEVSENERYQLALTREEAITLEPETMLTVRGAELDNNVVIPFEFDSDGEDEDFVLGASTIKNIAVIPFNFRNNQTQTLSTEEINRRFYGSTSSVAAHMRENSEGKWDIQGRVFNWVTLDLDASGCDYSGWATKAKESIVARGESLAGYTNFHYLFPKLNTTCAWSGLANMPGSQSWVVADYFGSGGISIHELGHNYGFHHAGTPTAEYGDGSDPMGGARNVHYSNYNKGRYWLGSEKFITATTSGTFTLNELKSASVGLSGIRIPRQDGTKNHLLLEYRGTGSFDNGLASTYANKVLVRVVPSTFVTSLTTQIAAIAPGASYTSAVDGVTIMVVSANGEQAQVQVQTTLSPCVTANPTVTASPSVQWGSPGQSLTYGITVRNNNSSSCEPSVFIITPTLPTGFTQLPDSGSLTIHSGMEETITFSIASPHDAVPGTYVLGQNVVNESDSSNKGSVSLNYNIAVLDTAAPAIAITSPASGTKIPGTKVTIAANASDTSGIATIQIQVDGAVIKTCSGTNSCTYNWNTRKTLAGTHTIKVVAVDNSPERNQSQAEIFITK